MKRRLCSLLFLGAILALVGCSDETVVDGCLCNEPPVVWLSSGPPEGSTTDYRIRFNWGGWDPDGTIAFYEYAITDNESGVFMPSDTVSTPGDLKWSRADGHDSLFTFSADQVADSSGLDDNGPYTFKRSHTFFIRAVDGEGAGSRLPAYRSFTATTLSPTVFIITPRPSGLNASPVPPITTFRWEASDPDGAGTQEPDSVRHMLLPLERFNSAPDRWAAGLEYIQQNPDAEEWSGWKWYQAPDDSGQFWTTPPLDYGSYYFAVQAMDEAGAVTPVFDHRTNLRRIIVRTDGWPILTVYNPYMGTIRTASFNTPPVIMDLPSGLEITFEFSATAEAYGGVIVGYRCRWNVIDPNDDDDWTPFVGETAICSGGPFFFGTHSALIEVQDNSGFITRFETVINIVPFTMENDLLLVDDWIENLTCFADNGGITPCDTEHDQFWLDMLESVAGFNPRTDVFELGGTGRADLPIQVLAKYKNVIWNATGDASGESPAYLDELITFRDPDRSPAFGRITPNLVAMYMAAGGHVLLAGNQIMTMVINPTVMERINVFPIIFRYELGGDQDGVYTGDGNDVGHYGVGEDSFAYSECCLNVLDQSYLRNRNQVRRTGGSQRCPVDRIRNNDRIKDGMRAALPIDMTTGGGFPRLELRPEVAGPGRFHEIAGLVVDIYNPLYFSELTPCAVVADIDPPRSCFEPIYGNGCPDDASVIYSAPVAFWTRQFETRIADAPGAIGARSVVWGFHPVYFEPEPVKAALEIILHDEWELPRKVSR